MRRRHTESLRYNREKSIPSYLRSYEKTQEPSPLSPNCMGK